MKNKNIHYLMIKNGKIYSLDTNNLIQTMNEEFEYFFDSRDYLFEEYKDIRIFVKDESIFTEKETIYYHFGGKLVETFHGTIIFAKLRTTCFSSLSKKEETFIKRKLIPINDTQFEIYD